MRLSEENAATGASGEAPGEKAAGISRYRIVRRFGTGRTSREAVRNLLRAHAEE